MKTSKVISFNKYVEIEDNTTITEKNSICYLNKIIICDNKSRFIPSYVTNKLLKQFRKIIEIELNEIYARLDV